MRYYLIAGEASGDLHGSNLIKGLKTQDPEAEFRFWGGDLMSAAAGGIKPVVHYKEGAVMGIAEVLLKAGQLSENIRRCKKDGFIHCADAACPTFNPAGICRAF